MSRYTVCYECGQRGHSAEKCAAGRARRPWQRRAGVAQRGPSAVNGPRQQRPPLQIGITAKRQAALTLREVTGQVVTAEWAARVVRHLLDGKSPANPAQYVRGAILASADPRTEFLPIGRPGYF